MVGRADLSASSMLNSNLDWERLRREFASAQPFPHVVLDGLLDPAFAREVSAAYPSLEQARALGREFAGLNERGKIQITDTTAFPEPVQRLNALLASPAFLERIAFVTGKQDLLADEALVGGGMHATGPRGRLDVHVDFNRLEASGWFRRLNVLVFLNPEWRAEWGGQLELWDEQVQHCHRSFEPLLNRCVLFETSERSYHGVAAVQCPAGVFRKSFAAYYYTLAAPPGWDGKYHTTIFRARPTEHLRGKLLMPLEQLSREVSDTLRRAKRAAKKITRRDRS
jgi:Rps23 Pro-64 3,4-dihydroxylase Tpa1-like proline 4-hydroxylase